jgi:Uma2 family endonuclease
VVEVISPSTGRIDEVKKLSLYFRLPSVAHYLIVDIGQRVILHHARSTGDTALTRRIVREGTVTLDPPGLELAVADVFGEM